MNKGLAWIENFPFGNWNKLWITTPEYLLLYAIICCAFGWIVHRKTNLLKASAVFIVLFLTCFSVKRFRAANQDEIIFLNLRKNPGIILKKGNEAFVITDLKPTDKTFQYSVQPYLDSCKSTQINLLLPDQSFSNTVFIMQNHIIQFGDKLIFIADKQLENKQFPEKIKVDYVFITGNPKLNLNQICSNFVFDLLILDAANPDYRIKNLAEEAALDGRKIKVLKRNNALIVRSNFRN